MNIFNIIFNIIPLIPPSVIIGFGVMLIIVPKWLRIVIAIGLIIGGLNNMGVWEQ